MKNKVFKALLYMVSSIFLSSVLALIIGKLYGFGFLKIYFGLEL